MEKKTRKLEACGVLGKHRRPVSERVLKEARLIMKQHAVPHYSGRVFELESDNRSTSGTRFGACLTSNWVRCGCDAADWVMKGGGEGREAEAGVNLISKTLRGKVALAGQMTPLSHTPTPRKGLSRLV